MNNDPALSLYIARPCSSNELVMALESLGIDRDTQWSDLESHTKDYLSAIALQANRAGAFGDMSDVADRLVDYLRGQSGPKRIASQKHLVYALVECAHREGECAFEEAQADRGTGSTAWCNACNQYGHNISCPEH